MGRFRKGVLLSNYLEGGKGRILRLGQKRHMVSESRGGGKGCHSRAKQGGDAFFLGKGPNQGQRFGEGCQPCSTTMCRVGDLT